jgi:SAM-dependent methyltransferase
MQHDPAQPASPGTDPRRQLLPPALLGTFDDAFARSCDLYDEYVHRLTLSVFRDSGLEAAARSDADGAEMIRRAGLDPARAAIPVGWILRQLAARGVLVATGTPVSAARYRIAGPAPVLDPAEILERQRAADPSWLPSYEIARIAAEGYPDFLHGKIEGEEILFSPGRVDLWFEYFSNANGLYSVNNLVGAQAALGMLREGGSHRVLELGGGLGSAALAMLDGMGRAGRLGEIAKYRFTEIVPTFLRRGQRALLERFPDASFLSFSRLDMNKRFEEQGVPPGSLDAVYAVNTLHVARDLPFTLGEIRGALAPGGAIILGECVRPFPEQAIYVEFVFNLVEAFRAPVLDPRFRPNGGFLTPEQWIAALETCGFRDVRFYPDIQNIRRSLPTFYVAAVGATRRD